MAYIQLTGGAYQTRSLIASAQRCLNLYVEPTPAAAGEPQAYTHYPTPGTTLIAQFPNEIIRATYRATTGDFYAVAGQQVFYVSPTWQTTLLGTFSPSAVTDSTPRNTPVSITDNGSVMLIADGSVDGWYVDLTLPLASRTLVRIDRTINSGWYGADRVDYQDTFFIANKPGTPIFYVSLSNVTASSFAIAFSVASATVNVGGTGYKVNDVLSLPNTGGAQLTVTTVDAQGAITGNNVSSIGALAAQLSNPITATGGSGSGAQFNLAYNAASGAFDPLDFASKSAMNDPLVAAVSVHRVIWLIGQFSYEIWFNSGGGGTGALTNNSFPFEIAPGAFGNWGCIAKNSIATTTNEIYWLHQDASGRGMVMQGAAYAAKRVSTFAIETEISGYPDISDAVGYCFQMEGHIWYVLNFPSANNFHGATWVYDQTVDQWHERAWIDANGIEWRHRANCATEVYNTNVCGDWQSKNLYAFDLNNYTDNGQPIKRLRSFPHMIDTTANRRVRFEQLIANMQVGTSASSVTPPVPVINCRFTAPDFTLLQNYVGPGDLGSVFTPVDQTNTGEIVNNSFIGVDVGSTSYEASGTPLTADYVVQFTATPTFAGLQPDNGTSLSVIGRAIGGNGYKASILSNGTQYQVKLDVMGTATTDTVNAGTIATGFFTVFLDMESTSINLRVQRSTDGTWLSPTGAWLGSETTAISFLDSTYTQPGNILIGGNFV